MKQKVKFGPLSIILTAGFFVLLIVGLFSIKEETEKLIPFCVIMFGTILFGLYYCPKNIVTDESGIKLKRVLGPAKIFEYKDIQSVDVCYPMLGGIRLCGSGGFFGFFGYFNDVVIGTYFAYYGSRDNCFLVKLKSGRKYVLGCENPLPMIEYISSRLSEYEV